MGNELTAKPFSLFGIDPAELTGIPPNHEATILFDGQAPCFVVQVPGLRAIPPLDLGAKINVKPVPGSAMMGFMPPTVSHFWPMWEGSGTSIQDVIGRHNASIPGDGSIIWLTTTTPAVGDGWPSMQQISVARGQVSNLNSPDITLAQPLVLTGSWSMDFCWRIPWEGANQPDNWQYWTHTTVTNDPDNGIQGYTQGVKNTRWASTSANPYPLAHMLGSLSNQTSLVTGVYADNFTITGLLQAMGYINGGKVQLEYMRLWRRALNLVEIQSLAADPFCMFGVTAETLAEITSIIEFMSPFHEEWFFMFNS